jgi:raffinose/stachyose/melibiose transport system permease protein
VLVIVFPLFWIFTLSLKLPNEVFEAHFILIPKHITFKNYPAALDYAKMYFKIGFPRMYLNSFVISAATIVLTLFVFFKKIHILNTYLAVVIPYTLFTVPIAVLIFKSFFSEIPRELKEAAIIDGASNLSYFLRVAIPIAKPAIATCIIYSFTLVWNEFLLALVFLGKDKLKPLPVAISNIAGGQYIVPYNIFTASMMICIIPILIVFLWLQKWFLRGVTMGALKG